MFDRWKSLIGSIALLVATITATALQLPAQDAAYLASINAERAEENKNLKAPDGWLSLVALEWIQPGDLTVGSSPGSHLQLPHGVANAFTLRSANGKVQLSAANPSLTLQSHPAKVGQLIEVNENTAAGLRWDTFTANLIKREDRLYLRIRDSSSPVLQHFHSPRFYPINPNFRFTAHYTPYSTPHTLTMATQTGQILKLPSPGYVEFKAEGTTIRLEPFEAEDGSLAFIFRDSTSRTKTYGSGRELTAKVPSNGLKTTGDVILDFNEATNPACAYTPFGTCPIPPPANRLTIAHPAGEQRYHE